MRNSQVKNMTDLEKNPNQAVENMVELIARLGAVLANETILLRQMKVGQTAPLQKEKEDLIKLLEKAKKHLIASKISANYSEQEKQELATVGRIFSEIAAENFRELKKCRAVNRNVINCISAAATDYFDRQRSYDNKGSKGGANKKQDNTLPPLTVNSVI